MLSPPFGILVVCVGNVCRSPLAERLLAVRLAEAGACASYAVSSAGLRAEEGRPMEPDAAAELRARGGDPAGFAARRLTAALVAQADLVLTATFAVRQGVLLEAPAALRRTFTLRELAALAATADPAAVQTPGELVADAARRRGSLAGQDLDVPDPMGRGAAAHAASARVSAAAVERLVPALLRVVHAPS